MGTNDLSSGDNNSLGGEQLELFDTATAAPTDGTDTVNTGTSPAADTDATPPSSGGQDKTDTNADAKADEPKSLDEVIEKALNAGAEKPEDANKASDTAPKDDDADKSTKGTVEGEGPETEPADPTDEEMRTYKPQVQKRISQLLSQRNEARRELETIRTDATNYQQIRSFMAENRLEDNEVAELFKLGADLKSGDPTRLSAFIQRVIPTVNAVLEATGQRVPADLAQKVQQGDLTDEMARQMARQRFETNRAREEAERATEQVQRVQQAQQTTAHVEAIRGAVTTWEQSVRVSDPDFDKKAPAMARFAKALVAEQGNPKTPAEAVEFSKRVYDEVNNFFKTARPAPTATKQTAPHGGGANSRSGATPSPNSLEEIIKAGLAMTVRG